MTKEEAIRRIKAWNLEPDDMEVLSVAIPELAESEDEKMRSNLMSLLANMRGDRITEETYQKYYPWLKSLHSRPKASDNWKPSEEQMNTMLAAEAIARTNGYPEVAKVLTSLYEQLKKLM